MKVFVVSITKEAERELLTDSDGGERELTHNDIQHAITVGLTNPFRSAARAEVIAAGLTVVTSKSFHCSVAGTIEVTTDFPVEAPTKELAAKVFHDTVVDSVLEELNELLQQNTSIEEG